MQRPKPATNEIYHIYNRGVEKRNVFVSDGDRLRFIHDLFEFNDVAPAENTYYRSPQSYEVGLRKIVLRRSGRRNPRKLLVEILAFCLMPNHFHLMVRQKIDNGITEFMRKLGTGYTNYFNQKNERSGALFQGKYKIAHVATEAHFIHLPYYIHLNPLDLAAPGWREKKLRNFKKLLGFLESYRWSSHLDYAGKKNFPSVTQRESLMEFFGSPIGYKKTIAEWLENLDLGLGEIREITLE